MEIQVSNTVKLWEVDSTAKPPRIIVQPSLEKIAAEERMPSDARLVSLAIYGKARAGKSTTLNYALAWLLQNAYDRPVLEEYVKQNDGQVAKFLTCPVTGASVPQLFDTANSADPCTRGADGVFVHLPRGAFGQTTDIVVLLIDCEGSGAEAEEHGNRTVLPALAFSSHGSLIYAQRDAITRDAALDAIEPIVEMAKGIDRSHKYAVHKSEAASGRKEGVKVASIPEADGSDSPQPPLGGLRIMQFMCNLATGHAARRELQEEVFGYEDDLATSAASAVDGIIPGLSSAIPAMGLLDGAKRNKQRQVLRGAFRGLSVGWLPAVARSRRRGGKVPESQQCALREALDTMLSETVEEQIKSSAGSSSMFGDPTMRSCITTAIPKLRLIAANANKVADLSRMEGISVKDQLERKADRIAKDAARDLLDKAIAAAEQSDLTYMDLAHRLANVRSIPAIEATCARLKEAALEAARDSCMKKTTLAPTKMGESYLEAIAEAQLRHLREALLSRTKREVAEAKRALQRYIGPRISAAGCAALKDRKVPSLVEAAEGVDRNSYDLQGTGERRQLARNGAARNLTQLLDSLGHGDTEDKMVYSFDHAMQEELAGWVSEAKQAALNEAQQSHSLADKVTKYMTCIARNRKGIYNELSSLPPAPAAVQAIGCAQARGSGQTDPIETPWSSAADLIASIDCSSGGVVQGMIQEERQGCMRQVRSAISTARRMLDRVMQWDQDAKTQLRLQREREEAERRRRQAEEAARKERKKQEAEEERKRKADEKARLEAAVRPRYYTWVSSVSYSDVIVRPSSSSRRPLGTTPRGHTLHRGARGGVYHMSSGGNRVYHKGY